MVGYVPDQPPLCYYCKGVTARNPRGGGSPTRLDKTAQEINASDNGDGGRLSDLRGGRMQDPIGRSTWRSEA